MEAITTIVFSFIILCGIDVINNIFEGFLR